MMRKIFIVPRVADDKLTYDSVESDFEKYGVNFTMTFISGNASDALHTVGMTAAALGML